MKKGRNFEFSEAIQITVLQHRFSAGRYRTEQKYRNKKVGTVFDLGYEYLPPRTWCLIYFLSDSIRFQNLRSTWTSSFSAAPDRTYKNPLSGTEDRHFSHLVIPRVHLSLPLVASPIQLYWQSLFLNTWV
jgi:hypothetical protein